MENSELAMEISACVTKKTTKLKFGVAGMAEERGVASNIVEKSN
ncbi:hypothetical protein D2E23_1881 [Bifidobacterium callimiconis]|uniref:Uncharacterized protein n=2 Tax=Bifidobacterium callimiconis TaxID=2306973 RepID=A0A430FBF3_9BIFI|nr:hypothetical protein D2E23_1881 [Bifidobacterium callimiconis]